MGPWPRLTAALAAIAVAGAACSDSRADERRTIVASIYPLAYAAGRIAGPDWDVIDLTPPGTEAHDLELSLEDRAAIEEADLVLYLGDIGFQPQVENAVHETSGVVASMEDVLNAYPGTSPSDPHFWLLPSSMRTLALDISAALDDVDPEHHLSQIDSLWEESSRMHAEYRQGLRECRFRTVISTHQAFGYLGSLYDLQAFGLTGTVPESEPTAERLAEAHRLVEEGEAGAVFYDEHENARHQAETFAEDAGVPALPLSTLESQPREGDYFDVIQNNLESLREGLQCT